MKEMAAFETNGEGELLVEKLFQGNPDEGYLFYYLA